MVDSLPKDFDWILGGDFNMTKRTQDKSKNCGRAISDLERFTCGELMNVFQVQDNFIHQGCLDSFGTMDNMDKHVGLRD